MKSQFRQDLVSGEWVLIASGRKDKPHGILKRESTYQPLDACPFEDFEKSGNGPVIYSFPENAGAQWRVAVINNKYPAVETGICKPVEVQDGFNIADGNGFHELVITRDHERLLTDFSTEEIRDLFLVYRERYKQIAQYACGQYIIIFHNFGKEGGATVYHSHSQIISLPILPPDVSRSLKGSEEYYNKHHREVYEVLIQQELEHKKRVIYQNDFYVAVCPFVSKSPYEVRIYPKRHQSHFEHIDDNEMMYVADILSTVLKKMKKALNDPSYNYFIHTAPVKDLSSMPSSEFYRWHIELLPRIKFDAGFEAGTGITMNIVDPDNAAQVLRDA